MAASAAAAGAGAGEEDSHLAGTAGSEAASHSDFDFAQAVFELEQAPSAADAAALKDRVLADIKKNNMLGLYRALAVKMGWMEDAELTDALSKAHTEKVAALDAAIADAREKFGDVEVYERQRAKADYIGRTWDRAGALAVFASINEKLLSTGQKIDIAMAKARLALLHGEWAEARERIVEAKALNEKGGDWDRRNRLKVYEGVHASATRDFAAAAALLLDSTATFTAVELCGYSEFVLLTVIAALKTLERPALKKRVVDSPDVLSSINDTPHLADLLNSFYEGRYRDYLHALSAIYPTLQRNRYLSRHAPYLLRELRLAGYAQFLQSYKSVTLVGMARTFGVTPAFLDGELARFIAAGRVHAKIDAVAGVVETQRSDTKMAQYAAVVKAGDALLSKVQRLSRVITL